jgi:hypothetical protein
LSDDALPGGCEPAIDRALYGILSIPQAGKPKLMIKVFEDFELSKVGQFQSVLESEGIRTHLKNQFTSSVLGEIPFVEALPELWILEEDDLPRARRLIQELLAEPREDLPEWTCASCDVVVDGVFTQCWKCGESRP